MPLNKDTKPNQTEYLLPSLGQNSRGIALYVNVCVLNIYFFFQWRAFKISRQVNKPTQQYLIYWKRC